MPHNRVHLREVTADGVKYWQAYWSIGAGKKRARSLGRVEDKSRADALKECEALERDHIVNPPVTGPDMTCKEWCDRYLAMHPQSPGTRRVYEESIARLDKFFGNTPVTKITTLRASDFRAHLLKDGSAEQTARKHCRVIKTMFGSTRGAVLHGIISKNPFAHLPTASQATDHKDDPALEHEHIERLIAAASTPAWKAAIALCAWAGLRRGEMKRIAWNDVLWERHRLVVRPTGAQATTKSKYREVLMEPKLERVLLQCLDAAQPGEARICPLTDNNNNRDLQTIIRAAGMKPWSDPFHTLRRFRANSWRSEGHQENHVDAWLGHTMETARKHYTTVPDAAYSPEMQISINLRKLFLSLEQPGKDRLMRFAETLVSRQTARKRATEREKGRQSDREGDKAKAGNAKTP